MGTSPGSADLRTTCLNVAYRERGAAAPIGAAEHVLATLAYGAPADPHEDGGLCLSVPLQSLQAPELVEVWTSDEPSQLDERYGFRLARSDSWLFGELPGAPPKDDTATLGAATRSAYQRLLHLAHEEDMHLLRVWNSVPDTLAGPPDFLRYMEFCQGRAEAFEEHFGAGFERHLCAFSAVGHSSADRGAGSLCLYFLAGKEPGTAVENPRQLSAYRYPPRYGPRSPSFARALRGPRGGGGTLFLSGTASIVGHESLHEGDVEAQTRETLRNMRLLQLEGDELSLVKVFLRRAEDLDAVRAILDQELGRDLPTLWLRADICRPELLVEIEGVALPR